MVFKCSHMLSENDITPKKEYLNRRAFMGRTAVDFVKYSALGGLTATMANGALAENNSENLDITPKKYATGYNNFYEFSFDKRAPAKLARDFNTDGWKVEVAGQCEKTGSYDFDDLIKLAEKEQRIYRFRCVEGWSMVIPWHGVSLAHMLKALEPNAKAKYVAFTTLFDPEQFPNQKSSSIPWPYRDGLRMDEAMNPLAFMATGMYDEDEIPNQNGAPLRLVVPWKYGFKCIKSIVKIEFTEGEPTCTWNQIAPNEYGFYANVNPTVSHPRWSQMRERIIGSGFPLKHRDTEIFNGYGEDVAHMYKNMDLRRFY